MTRIEKGVITIFLLFILIASCGCSTVRTGLSQPEEWAWQGLNVIDGAQTIDIARDPCYREAGPVSKVVLGDRPDEGAVVAWHVAKAVGHAAISGYLVERDYRRTYRVWQALSFVDVGYAVGNNYNIGIRIGAPNKHRGC